MGRIFISYSHKDTNYAHGLADYLKNMGFDVWIDERLDYGSQWPHEIQRQLDSCDAFILHRPHMALRWYKRWVKFVNLAMYGAGYLFQMS